MYEINTLHWRSEWKMSQCQQLQKNNDSTENRTQGHFLSRLLNHNRVLSMPPEPRNLFKNISKHLVCLLVGRIFCESMKRRKTLKQIQSYLDKKRSQTRSTSTTCTFRTKKAWDISGYSVMQCYSCIILNWLVTKTAVCKNSVLEISRVKTS